MNDFRERAQVIWGCPEVGVAIVTRHLQNRAYRCQKRCLSRAVIADEQGQRRNAGTLALLKTTKVAESEFP
jgi:hypothetical protein